MVNRVIIMRESMTDRIFNVVNYSLLSVVLLMVLYPLIYIVSASISDPVAVNSGEMWLWPIDITFEGYTRVLSNTSMWIGYRNTIYYTLLGVMVNLILTLTCGYALSKKKMTGQYFFTFVIVFTMFFSGGLIPTYLLVKDLGMVNTFWAMVIPNAVSAWNLIVVRTFFASTIPEALEEAAEIDGCSIFRTFTSVVLPLSKPVIAVMALFYGVMHWNQYFNALIYLSDRELYPLQLFLREILVLSDVSGMILHEGDVEAMELQAKIANMVKYTVMIVAALPMIVVYLFLQRYFVKGVMIGSLKG